MAERTLTPEEVARAQLAGIPADRPGLLGDFPKMLYKKGTPGMDQHALASDANGGVSHLPIAGHSGLTYLTVETLEDELAALDEGWVASIALATAAPAKKAAA